MTCYYINQADGMEEKFVPVPGQKLVIPGFEDVGLFIHSHGKAGRKWVVTSVESGAELRSGKTKAQAIENATATLNDYGKTIIKKGIARAIEVLGHAPAPDPNCSEGK